MIALLVIRHTTRMMLSWMARPLAILLNLKVWTFSIQEHEYLHLRSCVPQVAGKMTLAAIAAMNVEPISLVFAASTTVVSAGSFFVVRAVQSANGPVKEGLFVFVMHVNGLRNRCVSLQQRIGVSPCTGARYKLIQNPIQPVIIRLQL